MKEMRLWWSFTPITLTNSSRNQFHKRKRFPFCNALLGVEETQRRPIVATVEKKIGELEECEKTVDDNLSLFQKLPKKLKEIM